MSAASGQAEHRLNEFSAEEPPRRNSKLFYKFLRIIGDGSFSNVYYCKDAESGHEVAIKVCDKHHIIKENKIEYIMREKEALNWCNAGHHPFITTLYSTFQDEERLYFVLTYAPNGDLLNYIRELGKFSLEQARFYTAEIVHALEFLHHGLPNGCHIVHRDLKPENILLRRDMHIMLCDFGSVKLFDQQMNSVDIKKPASAAVPQQQQPGVDRRRDASGGRGPIMSSNMYRTKSFVGTAQYVSPEVLTGKPSSFGSDLWGLGCIIFQLLTGKWPFCGETEFFIFQRINQLDYSFPDDFNPAAKDLVQKLLVPDPTQRLGVLETGGYPVLRAHQFYSGVEWDRLPQLKPPPLRKGGDHVVASSAQHAPDYDEANVLPGFDDTHLQRLLFQFVAPMSSNGLGGDSRDIIIEPAASSFGSLLGIDRHLRISNQERAARLQAQAKDNIYHKLVEGKLIVKAGFLDKRVGLFARRRMFLLTEGPRLFYVDAEKMVLKGEIPFGKELRTEPKDFKVFFIHVPNRTYYLIDREGFAMEWVHEVNAVWTYYFSSESETTAIVGSNEAVVTSPSSQIDRIMVVESSQQQKAGSSSSSGGGSGKRGGSGGVEKLSKSSSHNYNSHSLGDSASASSTVDADLTRRPTSKK